MIIAGTECLVRGLESDAGLTDLAEPLRDNNLPINFVSVSGSLWPDLSSHIIQSYGHSSAGLEISIFSLVFTYTNTRPHQLGLGKSDQGGFKLSSLRLDPSGR